MSAPIDLRDVLRTWVLRQLGDESQRAFAKRTGLYDTDLSNLKQGKAGRQVTLEWVQKIVAAQGMTMSRALLEIARIAWELEEEQAVPKPPNRKVPHRPVDEDAPLRGTEIDVDALERDRVDATAPPRLEKPAPRGRRSGR